MGLEVPSANIDPNNNVPDLDSVSKTKSQKQKSLNPYDWTKKAGKREERESPEFQQRSKSRNVSIWQVAEFLHAFLKGTSTSQKYADLNLEHEARIIEDEVSSEDHQSTEEMEEVTLKEE